MIRHIVGFKLAAGTAAQREEHAKAVQTELETLPGLVPGIEALHVGIDQGILGGHWDAVLVSDFADNDALEAYQAHPEHVRVAGEISPLIADRCVVDYPIPG